MTDEDLESISLLVLEDGAAITIANIVESMMIIWAVGD